MNQPAGQEEVIATRTRDLDELAMRAAAYLRRHGAEAHVALVVGNKLMADTPAKVELAGRLHALVGNADRVRLVYDDHGLDKLLTNPRLHVAVLYDAIGGHVQRRIVRRLSTPRLTFFVREPPRQLVRAHRLWLRALADRCATVVFDLPSA